MRRVNFQLTTTTSELHPVPVQSPWFHDGIDFVGPVTPESVNGNEHILTLSDYFTKWVEAVGKFKSDLDRARDDEDIRDQASFYHTIPPQEI